MTIQNDVLRIGARVYDLGTRHRAWHGHCATLMSWFPHGRGRRVLDLGCGPGTSALAYRSLRPDDRVVGLDLAASMLRLAHRRDRRGGCAWMRGDALHLPFRDATFDVVTGHSFLYLVPDRPGVLAEARRVLRPGGRVVLLEPRHQGVLQDAATVARAARVYGPRFAATMSAWRVFAHASGAFREGELEALLSAAGLREPGTSRSLLGLGWIARATR